MRAAAAGNTNRHCRKLVCPRMSAAMPQEDFDKAAEEAKQLPDSTSNDDMLILYGLFKQVQQAAL